MSLKDVLAAAEQFGGVWLVGCAFIFFMIGPTDRFVSSHARSWLADNLSKPNTPKLYRKLVENLLVVFNAAFSRKDGVSDTGFWSVRFIRSAFSTVACLCVALLYLYAISEFHLLEKIGMDDGWLSIVAAQGDFLSYDESVGFGLDVANFIFIAFIVNFLVDYVSICETKWVLNMMIRRSFRQKFFWLFLDLLFTSSIVVVGVYLGNMIYDILNHMEIIFMEVGNAEEAAFAASVFTISQAMFWNIGFAISSLFQSACQIVNWTCRTNPDILSVFDINSPNFVNASVPFVVTTFLTSFWIWLYFSAIGLMRFFLLFSPLKRLVDFVADTRRRPYHAVALFGALIWTVAYWLLLYDPAVA